MKKLTNKQLAVALYQATKDSKGAELKQIISNFALLLKQQQKIKQAEQIISAYVAYAQKQAGIVEAKVTSARVLNEKDLENLKQIFKGKLKIIQSIDKNILGGVIVSTDNFILDACLKTQLAKLKLTILT